MSISGAEIIYGLKKASTWGSAVACGAGDGVLALPWSADPTNGLIVDDSLGQFFGVNATPGQTKLDVTFPAYFRYNDKLLLTALAAFFGTAGVPAAHAGGAASYDHTLQIARQTDGLFFTLAAKLGTGFVQEIPSWKIAKIELTFEVGQPVKIQFSGPGIDLVADSVINTLTSFNNVTILERINRAYMGQCVFRMNDNTGAALQNSDKIAPSKAVLTLERKLTGVYGAYNDNGAGRDLIDEPVNDGLFSGSLSLTFPRLANNTGRQKIKANTPQKLDVTITGPIIEGAIPYLIKFTLPYLVPDKDATPHKQGIIDNTRDYQVLGCTAAPSGMTGQTDPCWCALTNGISTNLLA